MTVEANYQKWVTHDRLSPVLLTELAQMDEAAKRDAFYKTLEFGTGGMRGLIGAGTNRINIYTVRRATEGLARYVKEEVTDGVNRGVVIAYDSRHFSAEFAVEAARVLGTSGVHVFLFDSVRSTPELSFAVRYLKAAAGIMITASHNPATYNGYKVYDKFGAQFASDSAETLIAYIEEARDPLTWEPDSARSLKDAGLLTVIGEEVDNAYLNELSEVTLAPELVKEWGGEVKIVFTPLHGVGGKIGQQALKQAGFSDVTLVDEQALPDPDFSTVALPNPEDPAAFSYAEHLGQEIGADVLIATDPDADRLGVATVRSDGTYDYFNGNELAALMLDYLLKTREKNGELPTNSLILSSIVSGALPEKLAESYGVSARQVLTGFKYIAEQIEDLNHSGTHNFLFGFEESYGYLLLPFVRDKDAIQALLLVSEMVADYKSRGVTAREVLTGLFETYGYHAEKTLDFTLTGEAGAQIVADLMDSLRKEWPHQWFGRDVITREDYLTSERHQETTGHIESIQLPQANALKFTLSDGSWVAVRPSGTEPKIKFYVGVTAPTAAEAEELLARFTEEVAEHWGDQLGVTS